MYKLRNFENVSRRNLVSVFAYLFAPTSEMFAHKSLSVRSKLNRCRKVFGGVCFSLKRSENHVNFHGPNSTIKDKSNIPRFHPSISALCLKLTVNASETTVLVISFWRKRDVGAFSHFNKCIAKRRSVGRKRKCLSGAMRYRFVNAICVCISI